MTKFSNRKFWKKFFDNPFVCPKCGSSEFEIIGDLSEIETIFCKKCNYQLTLEEQLRYIGEHLEVRT